MLKGNSLRGGAARKQLQQAAERSTRTDQAILTRFRTKAMAVKTKAKKPNTAGPNSTQRTRGTGHPASTTSISGTTTGTSRPTTRTTSTTTRRTRTPTGTRSREPQKRKPKSRPQQRRSTKPRSTDSTPRRAERPRSSTSSSSSSTSPSTRPADVRWACEKGTEGPRDGCSDQRHPQLGTSTTATTTTTAAT